MKEIVMQKLEAPFEQKPMLKSLELSNLSTKHCSKLEPIEMPVRSEWEKICKKSSEYGI